MSEEFGRIAYETLRKSLGETDLRVDQNWDELDDKDKQAWLQVVRVIIHEIVGENPLVLIDRKLISSDVLTRFLLAKANL